ncbi:zinc finger protein 275 isoform X2 [Sorex araneus]|uniref:zinc finger protein 275 isoform X2 n=1 Tax=Sorex araneus TaxID=42254 RepID=UPI002433B8B7|nr:zinc finger protein 275 isoform X2 [Sorex araneus]
MGDSLPQEMASTSSLRGSQPPGPEAKQKGDVEGKGGAAQNLLIEHFFSCKECGDAFRLKALLVQHQRIHSEQKGWKCHDCGKVFRKVGDFNEHRKSHMPPPPPRAPRPGPSQAAGPAPRPTAPRPGPRPSAPRPAPRPEPRPAPRAEARKRERPERETKAFKCEECGKRFKKNAGLSQHLRVHSREKPWACEECGRAFKN